MTVYVNGERGDRAPWPIDVVDRIASAAPIVGAMDDTLRAGDRIITGSIIQQPVAVGNQLRADFGDHATIVVNPLGDD